MHSSHDIFIAAIHSKNKLLLSFYSKEDGEIIVRTCAPMDFAPSSRAKNKDDRYHFWDYDSDKERHTLSLLPDQVISIEKLDDGFEPAEFVTWATKWVILRDWGQYS